MDEMKCTKWYQCMKSQLKWVCICSSWWSLKDSIRTLNTIFEETFHGHCAISCKTIASGLWHHMWRTKEKLLPNGVFCVTQDNEGQTSRNASLGKSLSWTRQKRKHLWKIYVKKAFLAIYVKESFVTIYVKEAFMANDERNAFMENPKGIVRKHDEIERNGK